MLIPFDPNGRQAISEVDIYNIVALQERAASAQAKVDLIANRIADCLRAGGAIDDDCQYSAHIEVSESAGIREERLVIDGICRWRRIAGSAGAIRRNTDLLLKEPS